MPQFGKTSRARLETCDPRLQEILNKAIAEGPDFSVLCGHRNEADQNKAVAEGRSKTPWPRSKHNGLPSKAVDIAPYPIDWNDTNRFRVMAGYVMGVAAGLGYKLRWGGDWDRDFSEEDERFRDLPHFELVED
ncbi:MAG: M15 family metallopeptidase [Magnetovibrionaceae bacterium]